MGDAVVGDELNGFSVGMGVRVGVDVISEALHPIPP